MASWSWHLAHRPSHRRRLASRTPCIHVWLLCNHNSRWVHRFPTMQMLLYPYAAAVHPAGCHLTQHKAAAAPAAAPLPHLRPGRAALPHAALQGAIPCTGRRIYY